MDEPAVTSAASVKIVDAITALVIFGVGTLVAWDSYRSGAQWGSDGPEIGYFPFYIGILLCIASLVNFVNALRRRSVANGGAGFVGVAAFKLVLSVILPTLVYVALIGGVWGVPGLGIYVASLIFIAGFMRWLGRYRWPTTLCVSSGVPITFFLMFEIWFKVPLPKGPLEAALGLS